MRNNKITGIPLPTSPDPRLTKNAERTHQAVRGSAKGLTSIMEFIFGGRYRYLFLFLSWAMRSWVLIVVVVIVFAFRRSLPPISVSYIFGGVSIAITIAGVAVPLLNLMDPREAFAKMLSLRVIKESLFKAQGLPKQYLDHPQVNTLFRESAGNGPAKQSQEEILKTARRTFETGLIALLAFPWLRDNRMAEWLALSVPVSFALGTVMAQEIIQVMRWVAREGKKMEEETHAG